jgi:hypothetical protein
MKSTDKFKEVIGNHLQALAANDAEFAVKLANDKKSIDDCSTYILNQVKKSGQMGYADEEIFGMAIHYYDEESIEVGEAIKGRVVVNHHIEAVKTQPSSITSLKETKAPSKKAKKKEGSVLQESLFS